MSLSDLTGRYSRQSSAKRRTFEVIFICRMYSRFCHIHEESSTKTFVTG